jgi:hypothetical protein
MTGARRSHYGAQRFRAASGQAVCSEPILSCGAFARDAVFTFRNHRATIEGDLSNPYPRNPILHSFGTDMRVGNDGAGWRLVRLGLQAKGK